MGWDLEAEISRGMIEFIYIPQPDIKVALDHFMMQDRIRRCKLSRVAIDATSVFLPKIHEAQIIRGKIYQIAKIT